MVKLVGGFLDGADLSEPTTKPVIEEKDDRFAGFSVEDMVGFGKWACLREWKKAEEEDIGNWVIQKLEATYLDALEALKNKSPSTHKTYLRTFEKFADWCKEAGAVSLPAHPGIVAMYLHVSYKMGENAAQLRRIRQSISYWHKFKKEYDPTDHPLIEAMCYEFYKESKNNERQLNGEAKKSDDHVHV